MTQIPLKFVSTSSKDDPAFPAKNLQSSDENSTWKCQKGQSQAVAIFEFDQSHCIDSLIITNNHSAFVEISVAQNDSPFDTLLPTLALMSPSDSKAEKNGTKTSTCKIFELIAAVRDKLCDRVKITCTQPFNTNIGYGLSSIQILSSSAKETKLPCPAKEPPTKEPSPDLPDTMPAEPHFSLAEETPAFKPGALFASRTQNKSVVKETQPMVGTLPERVGEEVKITPKPKEKHKRHISDENEETGRETKKTKTEEPSPIKSKLPTPTSPTTTDSPTATQPASFTALPPTATKASGSTASASPPAACSTTATSTATARPTTTTTTPSPATVQMDKSHLLSGVTFVLSGFENPLRSNLRDRALAMGARYSANWTPRCTHLVAAFPNTPKVRQVNGQGIIVTKYWLIDCDTKGRRLDEKDYPIDPPTARQPTAPRARPNYANDSEDSDDNTQRVRRKRQNTGESSDTSESSMSDSNTSDSGSDSPWDTDKELNDEDDELVEETDEEN